MKVAACTFYDSDELPPVVYHPGDEVPDEVAAKVGAHCVVDADSAEATTDPEDPQGPSVDPDDVVGDDDDLGGGDDEGESKTPAEPPFNPGDHDVAGVLAYLERTTDEAERDRVLAAEREGKKRKSILGDDED